MRETIDTIVIGAGQAGLVMSHFLARAGREHVVLERHRIAERWRSERWDGLHFQYPNWSLRLPGKTYDGPFPDAYAPYPEILRFLTDYAAETAAPVREGVEVARLSRDPSGSGYRIDTSAGPMTARQVVIATGPFQRARIPDQAADLPAELLQLDAASYRSPAALPAGAVLVVGSGASGCQIADELCKAGRRVFLSVSRHRRVPRRYRGQDMFWWFEKLGRYDTEIDSFPGRRYPPSTVVTGADGGYDVNLRQSARNGVTLLGRLTGVAGGVARFGDDLAAVLDGADQAYADFRAAADALALRPDIAAMVQPPEPAPYATSAPLAALPTLDLAREGISSVIWCTGHRFDFGWIDLPILDSAGAPVQQRGVTSCPGVCFLGLHWMHKFKSGQFSFVAEDAAFLAQHLADLDLAP